MATTTTVDETFLNELASSYENLSSSATKNDSSEPLKSSKFPSPAMMYQTGLLLYWNNNNKDGDDDGVVLDGYQQVIKSIPKSHLSNNILKKHLNGMVESTSKNHKERNDEEEINLFASYTREDRIRSLTGLYSNSPIVCSCGWDLEMCLQLVRLYDSHYSPTLIIKTNVGNDEEEKEIRQCLLRLVSSLLLHGLVLNDDDDDDDDESHLQYIMDTIECLNSDDDKSMCLGDVQEFEEKEQDKDEENMAMTLSDAIMNRFPDTKLGNEHQDQREYLLLMLRSCPRSSSFLNRLPTKKITVSKEKNKTSPGPLSIKDKIKQVINILPHLGGGYVEVALACYNNDVDRTISALLDPSSIHPRLSNIDPKLPFRNRGDSDSEEEEQETRRAKGIQKRILEEMIRGEEEEAYEMEQFGLYRPEGGEYEDDYDDRYDDNDDGGAGGADGGYYDGGMVDNKDYDRIRKYNQLKRDLEKEDLFWQENRNINHQIKPRAGGGKPKDDDDDDDGNNIDNEDTDEKKYRGPDKGKGGRLIGPDGKYLPIKKGGKKGRRQQQQQQQQGNGGGGKKQQGKKGQKGGGGGGNNGDNSNGADGGGGLSKIQKRRKNDNKAKIGNHHRKERAAKKTGGF